MSRPWNIFTHSWPHFDEAVAIVLLMMYGEDIGLADINDAVISFIDAGSSAPPHLSNQSWKEARAIGIGVFGSWSPFDEHADEHQARQHKQCAASLAYAFIQSRCHNWSEPIVETLVAYATRIDLKGNATPESMPNLIKNLNWARGEKAALDWVIQGIEAYLECGDPSNQSFEINYISSLMDENDGQRWLETGRIARVWERERFQKGIEDLRDGRVKQQRRHFTDHGKKRKLVAVENDNPLMVRVLLTFVHADVAIVRKSTGHVAILTNANTRINLASLSRTLNRTELTTRGDTARRDFGELGRGGSVRGSVWSYQPDLQALLNGSPSAPSIQPTAVPFDHLIELAALALDETRFSTKEDGFACNGTICQSSPKHPCPLYDFGLIRCTALRKKAKFGSPGVTDSEKTGKPARHNGHKQDHHQTVMKDSPFSALLRLKV